MTSADLQALVLDARIFDAELARFACCERADAETDPQKRLEARRRVVDAGFVWKVEGASAAETDLLFAMAREAARIALARRSASFRAKWSIDLTCGDAPVEPAAVPEA